MYTDIFEDLGLSNAEAKVYLALLDLGPSKTGNIIDKTKLQSSTMYHVLGALLEKGVVSYVHKGKIKFYQANNPESFLEFLDEKRRRYTSILDELKAKEAARQQKKSAKVYEGVKGVQVAFADVLLTLEKGQEYYFFQFPYKNLQQKEVCLFMRNYHLKREDKGIRVKGITFPGAKNLMHTVFGDLKHAHIKYVDEVLPTGVVIYGDKVMSIEWGSAPTAFVIQSATIHESYRRFFLDKWKQATP